MAAKRERGDGGVAGPPRRTALLAGLGAILLACRATAAQADDALVVLDDPVEQGRLVRGRCTPGCRLDLDGRPVRTDPQGRFVIGFGRDHPPGAELRAISRDGRTTSRRLEVASRSWDVQRIDGLPPAQVTPSDPAVVARIDAERVRIRAARATDSDGAAFAGPFVWPVEGPRSGVYGSQRILNGQPRAPHLGVDVAAPEGTPVQAAADGTVRLADPDLFFTGGTVIVDHGFGVGTIYAHLSRVDVAQGDAVTAGKRLGAVGRTGRATGPHLHLGLYWFDRALDPESVLPPHPGGP